MTPAKKSCRNRACSFFNMQFEVGAREDCILCHEPLADTDDLLGALLGDIFGGAA